MTNTSNSFQRADYGRGKTMYLTNDLRMLHQQLRLLIEQRKFWTTMKVLVEKTRVQLKKSWGLAKHAQNLGIGTGESVGELSCYRSMLASFFGAKSYSCPLFSTSDAQHVEFRASFAATVLRKTSQE